MNTGILSTRYARALLAFSQREGDADTLCRQAALLLQRFDQVPRLRALLSDRILGKEDPFVGLQPPRDDKGQLSTLLRAALGDEALTPSLERFLTLVQQKGRVDYLPLMLRDFIRAYYRARNIHPGRLVSAIPLPEETVEKYRRAAEKHFGGRILLETELDPSLIGGVVLTVDGHRLDASVAGQLQKLRSELIDKNKRIV